MEIDLLRHGMTQGNLDRRYMGREDQPLCPDGAAEAVRAGQDLSVEKVYVSPLIRARQTAGLLFPKARQVVCPDLQEMDFGDYEGHTGDELMAGDETYRKWVERGGVLNCPHGESMPAFAARINAALLEVIRQAAENKEERVVVVCHGGAIMTIMAQLATPERGFYDWLPQNCQGWRVHWNGSNEGRMLQLVQKLTGLQG